MIGCSYKRTELQSPVDRVLEGPFKGLKALGALSQYGKSTADDEVATYARLGPCLLLDVIGYSSLVSKIWTS